jgi:membrane protein
MGLLKGFLPEGIYSMLRTTISDILSIQRGGVTSFNFIMAFAFSSNGVTSMLTAFDKSHDNYKKRKFLQKQWVSFKLVVLVSFMFLVSITLVILGERTIKNIIDLF